MIYPHCPVLVDARLNSISENSFPRSPSTAIFLRCVIATYPVVDIQVVRIVGVDRSHGVYRDQRVLDVRGLVLGPDVSRTLPEPRATLHACHQNATF